MSDRSHSPEAEWTTHVVIRGPGQVDTDGVEDAAQTTHQDHSRRRVRLLLVLLAAVVVGVLTALRLTDRWVHDGIPTGGLVFFGVFATVDFGSSGVDG